MPRNLKIHLPAIAKTTRTPAITQQANPAIRIRASGVSVGVIARKAGTVASGSMITKSELEARKMYSERLKGTGSWLATTTDETSLSPRERAGVGGKTSRPVTKVFRLKPMVHGRSSLAAAHP